VHVNPQEAWADDAKKQRTLTESYYRETQNTLNVLIATWGKDAFVTVLGQIALGENALSKGQNLYDQAAYQEAYNAFAESYELIDRAMNDALNTEDNLVADKKEADKADQSLLEDTTTLMRLTLERFNEVSLYVDKVAQTTGYDQVAGLLESLEKSRAYYNEGNQYFQKGNYDAAYDSFNIAYSITTEVEAEATRLRELDQFVDGFTDKMR